MKKEKEGGMMEVYQGGMEYLALREEEAKVLLGMGAEQVGLMEEYEAHERAKEGRWVTLVMAVGAQGLEELEKCVLVSLGTKEGQ